MKWFKVIFIFAITQIGCTSSYVVSQSPAEEDFSFSEFNSETKQKNATIVFKDSLTLACQEIFSQPDSTSCLNLTTGVRTVMPTNKIKKIVVKNKFYGTLEGAGIGILSGAGGGFLVGAALEEPNSKNSGLATVVCMVIGGGVGLITGTLSGVVVGHTYEYEFPDQSENLPSPDQKNQHVELDAAQKMVMYESSKKSSGTAVPLSLILPSAGHYYANKWSRGLPFAVGRVGGIVLVLTGTKDVYESTPIGGGIGYIYSQQTEYTGWFYAGIASFIVFTIWEAIDVSSEVEKYNGRLSKRIMGEKSFGVNIVPSKNGPHLQFSYSF